MSPQNGAADGRELLADGQLPRGLSLTLPLRRLGKRASLPLAAFLIGVAAFATWYLFGGIR